MTKDELKADLRQCCESFQEALTCPDDNLFMLDALCYHYRMDIVLGLIKQHISLDNQKQMARVAKLRGR